MAIRTFKGPNQLGSATEAVLTSEFSAVVVSDVLRRAKRLNRKMDATDQPSIDLLRSSVDISPVEQPLVQWADERDFISCNLSDGFDSPGSSSTHTDAFPLMRAFSLSVAMTGSARWRTQLSQDRDPHAIITQFDETRPIDEFTQNVGDFVFIPTWGIHEISAANDRVARVFVAQAESS